MSLVYCPRTHAYFGHPPYPLHELIAKNVRVVLGTDSRASNPDLSLLAELRFVVEAFPALKPQVILEMATRRGAEALGQESRAGSITAGKDANLVAVPLFEKESGNADDLLASSLASDLTPSQVWYRGVAIG
jgi:cytosine/adenosine deaminase-related metal-dependent hydrolase